MRSPALAGERGLESKLDESLDLPASDSGLFV